jgi:hypothetical protein
MIAQIQLERKLTFGRRKKSISKRDASAKIGSKIIDVGGLKLL